jgi:exosortase
MTHDFETLYWLVFCSVVLTLLILERVRGLQRSPARITNRWTSNIALFMLGSLVSALMLPIGIYAFAAQRPSGPMAQMGVPFVLQVVVTFLLLDLWNYWQHRLFHRTPWLWRCHLVHHSDTEVDVTTSERHHPLEIGIGVAVLIALVTLLALPATALGLYLVTATAVALYSHANVRLPATLDRALSGIFVTPSVHAVHHSSLRAETDSNFGTVLTVWDRWFGTFVDPAHARIPHFGLDYFHRPVDTRLWRVLQQPFRFHRYLDHPRRDDAYVEARARSAVDCARSPLTRDTRAALLAGLAGMALVMVAMAPTVLEMIAVWRSNEAYQYAWLVLPMVAYLLLGQADVAARALDARPGLAGIFVVLVAAIGWCAAMLMNLDVGRQLAFVLALHGIALSTLGWHSYRQAFPGLALLFLMVPSGDLLQPALRALTVGAIELFAWAVHIPYSVDGFVVHIGGRRYIVVDECAGLPYVTLTTFLGYCFGVLLYRTFVRAAGMALLGAALAVICNAIRVNAIVLIDWLRGSQMDLAAHGTVQWIMLFVTVGALLYVLSRSKDPAAHTPMHVLPATKPGGALSKWAPVIGGSGLLLVVGLVGVQTQRQGPQAWTASLVFPQEVSGWRLGESAPAWQIDYRHRTQSIRANYRRGDREFEVAVIQSSSPNAKLQDSPLPPGERARWREKQIARDIGCVNAQCIEFVHVTWLREGSQELRHAYFIYGIGSFLTDSRFWLRAMHGWRRLTGAPGQPTLTVFRSDTVLDPADVAAALRAVQAGMQATFADAGEHSN